MFQIKVVDLIEIHIFCCKHFLIGMIFSQKISGKLIFKCIYPLVSAWCRSLSVFYILRTEIDSNETKHPSPLYQSHRFFTPSKLKYITMKEGTPPPSTEATIFYIFQTRIGSTETTHPSLLYVFETGIHPSKLKFMHHNERRYASPASEAIVFSRLPNWNAYR